MKRIINTSLKNYKKDIGISEIEKQIEILKQKAALPCIYAFIDIKREFVSNGALYIGQSKSVKNRMINYKGKKTSEILQKLQKRFNLWDEYWGINCGDGMIGHPNEEQQEEINKLREFIEDPKRCKLLIKLRKKDESEETRKKIESLYIKRYMPFLNKEPWKGGWRRNQRKFYMNQLHPDQKQRSNLPVYCLYTHEIRDNPTEEYIAEFNRRVDPTKEFII